MAALTWISCSPWEFRLCVTLSLLAAFYGGLSTRFLVADAGFWLTHHALLLFLLVTPWWWLQLIGVVSYLDDVFQHAWRRHDPTYESPLHQAGWVLVWAREQIGYRLPQHGRWGRIRNILLAP